MIILGLSGKKQSGKDTLCTYIQTLLYSFYNEQDIKVYSFADKLKQLCIEILGLTYDQCYGTDEDKNTLTIYKWENLSKEIRHKNKLRYEYATNGEICDIILPTGFMTAREILQIVGTDIFREMFSTDIWVDATFRDINKAQKSVNIITDARFPGEIKSILDYNGYVIRLTRNILYDKHESEIALDHYDFNQKNICIIDNQDKDINYKNKEAAKYISSILAPTE